MLVGISVDLAVVGESSLDDPATGASSLLRIAECRASRYLAFDGQGQGTVRRLRSAWDGVCDRREGGGQL